MTNAISGLGLAPDAAMITFPIDMFLPGSDISGIEARKTRILSKRLTALEVGACQSGRSGRTVPMLRKSKAETYEDALQRANDLAITNLWGDGLPLWPATRERVNRMLRGTPLLPRTHVIGKFPPRGGITTVETCAVSLAMAGGRPEYLPVLIAAVEAFLHPGNQCRAIAGRLRQRVAGGGGERTDCQTNPFELRLRLPRPRSAAPRRVLPSAARCG